jgi:hypothetical protein
LKIQSIPKKRNPNKTKHNTTQHNTTKIQHNYKKQRYVNPNAAIRVGEWKLLVDCFNTTTLAPQGSIELYNITADPHVFQLLIFFLSNGQKLWTVTSHSEFLHLLADGPLATARRVGLLVSGSVLASVTQIRDHRPLSDRTIGGGPADGPSGLVRCLKRPGATHHLLAV